MQNRWFVRRGQGIYGPFSEEQLRQLAAAGKLSPSDMLQAEGSSLSIPATSFQNLFPSSSSQPTADAVVQRRVAARRATRRSSQEESPTVATGTELPAFEFTVWGRPKRILLEVVRSGTLTKVTKTERQYISGSGGGGYVYGNYTPGYGGYVSGHSSPISITTTYETTMELWILGADGRESSFYLDEDIPLKKGHTVTIVNGYLEGSRSSGPCLVVNHSAREAHFLSGGESLIRPNYLWKVLCSSYAILGWFAVFFVVWEIMELSFGDDLRDHILRDLPPSLQGVGRFFGLLSLLAGFLVCVVQARWLCLKKVISKFRQHCYRVGKQLLRGSF
jgi:hypothetical protein